MPILLLLLLLKLATGTILEVPADYPTVQAALDATQSGDTVLVAPGTWHGNLVTPNRELTLASHFLFSRDSLDIQQTILDGDSLDSVVRIENSEGNCLSMTGFSVENGLATHAGIPDGTGGGIHLVPGSCANLEHLVIQGNHSSIYGAAFKAYLFHENQPACTLKHIRINHNPQYIGEEDIVQMHFWSHGPLVVEDLQIDGQGYVGQGINLWGTPLNAEDVSLRNTSHGRFSLTSSSDATYRNITMEHCRSVHFGLTAADDSLHVSDVQIRNCMWGDWWSTGVSIDSSPLVLDSLVFEHNRIIKGAETSGLSSLMRVGSWPQTGRVENVIVRENMVGDSIPPGAGDADGYSTWVRLLDMVGINVKALKVLDNVIHDAYRGPSLRYNRDGMFALYQGAGLNTVFEDAEFADNLVVDHGEFSPTDPDGYSASQGRSIRFLLGRYNEEGIPTDTTLIRNLVFQNERMPNHAPETGGIGHMSVGSVLEVKTSFFSSVLQMENVIVRDCDDGGIYMFLQGQNSTVRNIQVENVARRGLCVEDWNAYEGTHEISNVWISGVKEQDMYLPYPYEWSYQQPIAAYGSGELIRVSNVTVEACSSRVGMWGEADWDNCLFHDNQFTHFFAPAGTIESNTFNYSVLPEEMPGQSNLIGVDPIFNEEHGSPFLSHESPCIDAGHPDLQYRDVADPENPGWALWPSQGGLRNDIGYTGGPYAAVPDTNWVHVEPDTPILRPDGFQLGNPYPNPFNALARIDYWLQSPERISINVHNILGQKVATLASGMQPAGRSTILIDGSQWASGVYFITLHAEGEIRTKKLLLMK